MACAERKNFIVPDSYHQNIRNASRNISLSIAPELEKTGTPWNTRHIVVGDFVNLQTAEMTNSGHDLHAMLLIDLRQSLPGMKVSELTSEAKLDEAIAIQGITQYMPNRGGGDAASWFKVTITATDLMHQRKIGETAVFVNARYFDPIPSKFFRDSPMYLTGVRHKERLASMSGDIRKIRSILQTDAFIADAMSEYEKGNYNVSEGKFKAIVNMGDKSNLIALSGLYQSLIRQNKKAEAEVAFANLAREAIAEDNLSVKFLFRVRSKEFRDDGDLETQYAIWIRQIAKTVYESGKCLNINGHASKSGKAEFNDRLSLHRAQWIKDLMTSVEPRLNKRLYPQGKGYRENIIGSGTDNALDAIDRRVDFKIVTCH